MNLAMRLTGPALGLGTLLVLASPTSANVLDSYSSPQNFLDGKYTFVPVAGTPAEDVLVSDGDLHIRTLANATAAYLWNDGDYLGEVGDWVSIEVELVGSGVTGGLYLSDTLGSGGTWAELRLDSGGWVDGPFPRAFLNGTPEGMSTMTIEVMAVTAEQMDLEMTFVGFGFDAVVQPFTLETTSLYFGPVAYQTTEANEVRHDELSADASVVSDFPDIAGHPINDEGGWGTSWIDFDGDGDLDLHISGNDDRMYRNDDGSFVDVTSEVGLENRRIGQGAAWGDYDNDGDPDLYVANWGEANQLYRNDNGTFTDVTVLAGPLGDTNHGSGVNWVDYDLDGDLDLYLVNRDAANRMYRNDGILFTDVSAAPLNDSIVGGQAATWGDYDNDGDLDVYLTREGATNSLLRNVNGIFIDATVSPIDGEVGNSLGAAWGDYDNDNDLDLFVGNEGSPSRLYRNDGGSFVDVTGNNFAAVTRCVTPIWMDVDNDGDLDLAMGVRGSNRIFRNDGSDTFTDIANSPMTFEEHSRGTTAGDFDQDGDLDLYHTTSGGPNRLIRNELDTGNHWIQFNLEGTQSNRSAIGARVRIVAGGVAQIREITSGGAHFSSESPTVEFGIGSATVVDAIQIFWPSGLVQQLSSKPADQVLEVLEGESVSVALGDLEARWTGEAVELRWELAGALPDPSFVVSRRDDDSGSFVRIGAPIAEASPGTFTLRDTGVRPGADYTYRLDLQGGSVEDAREVAIAIPQAQVWLSQNSPNPFNPQTTIRFSVERETHVQLRVFDARGRHVTTVLDGPVSAGSQAVVWDGRDEAGRPVGSGTYFYSLDADGRTLSRTMLLVK